MWIEEEMGRLGNSEQAVGRWVSGSNGSLFGWVTWVMGQYMLTHDPPLFHVPVKYRQKFTAEMEPGLRVTGHRVSIYLSVKCAVLMHLSFTCITATRMIDFGVVCLSTCFQH